MPRPRPPMEIRRSHRAPARGGPRAWVWWCNTCEDPDSSGYAYSHPTALTAALAHLATHTREPQR